MFDRPHRRPGAADGGLGGARVRAAGAAVGALRRRPPAGLHRRRRLRLHGVPAGRRRALGPRPPARARRPRRAALARLDVASRAAARRPRPRAPRARRRALPAAGRGARRRRRPRRGRAGRDAVPPRAGLAGAAGPGGDHPQLRVDDRRPPAPDARAHPPLRHAAAAADRRRGQARAAGRPAPAGRRRDPGAHGGDARRPSPRCPRRTARCSWPCSTSRRAPWPSASWPSPRAATWRAACPARRASSSTR